MGQSLLQNGTYIGIVHTHMQQNLDIYNNFTKQLPCKPGINHIFYHINDLMQRPSTALYSKRLPKAKLMLEDTKT